MHFKQHPTVSVMLVAASFCVLAPASISFDHRTIEISLRMGKAGGECTAQLSLRRLHCFPPLLSPAASRSRRSSRVLCPPVLFLRRESEATVSGVAAFSVSLCSQPPGC